MVVLVTGVKGQLGYDVVNELEKRGIKAVGVDIDEMDITDEAQVEEVMNKITPDAVIHCAAYTAVDAAEDNRELCKKINVDGTRFIANQCKQIGAKMVYLSTDYVFDGEGEKPWSIEDRCEPLNWYGDTKYQGEEEIKVILDAYFIVRISWVFGINGHNFIKAILNKGKELGEVSVVNDQFGSPTYTADLAKLLVDMCETEKYGIYHATNEGICSWYEFAVEIFKQEGLNVKVTGVDSSTYPVKAKRPSNSRMSKNKLVEEGFERLPDWKDALKRYLKVIK